MNAVPDDPLALRQLALDDFLAQYNEHVLGPILVTADGALFHQAILAGKGTMTSTVSIDPPAVHVTGTLEGNTAAVLQRRPQGSGELAEALVHLAVCVSNEALADQAARIRLDKQLQAGHMALAASVEERATLRRVRVLAVPLHGGDPVVLSTAVMQRHEDSSAAGAMH